MEKLIELLNEYLCPFSWYIQYHNENGFKRTPTKSAVEWDRMLQDEYVLGKSFGFIKWLVENDKIDLLQLDNRIALSMSIEFNKVERVLMALSISDTPIDLLCSLLK